MFHCMCLIHRCIDHLSVFVHMCIGNQSWLIYIYVYICVHSPSIFFDNMYALVINLYDWFVTHMYSGLVCVAYPELMLVQCQLTTRMSTQGAVQKIRKQDNSNIHKTYKQNKKHTNNQQEEPTKQQHMEHKTRNTNKKHTTHLSCKTWARPMETIHKCCIFSHTVKLVSTTKERNPA